MTVYTFCEPVQNLLAFTPIHIREIADGRGPHYGGYPIKEACPTLCGRVPYYGWDLEGEVNQTTVENALNAEVHPACPRCVEEWRRRHGMLPPAPKPSVQGYRLQGMIVDEIADVGF